jgi:hypothetical protein
MGRIMLLTLFAAIAGGLLAVSGAARTSSSGAPGVPAPAAFRLTDGSAGCAFDGSRLACGSRTGATAVLEADGSSHPADEEVAWNDSTPVLHRTESWWHGGFGCRVDGDEIVCERENGSIAVGGRSIGGASSTTSD